MSGWLKPRNVTIYGRNDLTWHRQTSEMSEGSHMTHEQGEEEKQLLFKHALWGHLLLAGAPASFLDPDPDGEGRVPLPFFGRMVPLFTVGRKGRVAIIGLAEVGK